MMINNKTSTPFKIELIKFAKGNPEIVEPIKKISKLKYSKPKAIVEQEISQRSFVESPPISQAPPMQPPIK